MASGFFALLDDITLIMDDVATMSKVATKKTAGIIGDDLAVNAEKATGFESSRELPVLWKIAVGSLVNKLIILPIVFVLNYFLPVLVVVILIAGGLFLAYEGAVNIFDAIPTKKSKKLGDKKDSEISSIKSENQKVWSAIQTDFILSLEIVIIALSTVLDQSLGVQILTVSIVALVATIGVYGLVALLIRMDEFGLALYSSSKGNAFLMTLGTFFIRLLPVVIRLLRVVGTLALILVASGIFAHNIPAFHSFAEYGPIILIEFAIGLVIGTVVLVTKKWILSLFSLKITQTY